MESQTNLKAAVTDLEALIGNLDESGKKFADSLINGPYGYKKRGSLSEKQAPYIFKLLKRAMGVSEISSLTLNNVAGIVAVFDKAKQHLKYPKIVMGTDFGKVQIWVQGQKAKFPGAIGLTVDKIWLGRILTDGAFSPSKAFSDSEFKEEFLDLLNQFSTDPVGVAAKYGKLSCKCVFCQLPLKDEKSLGVGYGPVCADHFGLPWGSVKLGMAQVLAS
jgi:hypothetical protein